MHYLSSCSITKGEENYIDDFVHIHKHLGVEFFLFFDRSDLPLADRFKGRDDIEVIHYPEPNRHHQAFGEGVKYFQGKSKWVQFIDIDQVCVPLKDKSLPALLQRYEDCGALGLNWHSFGSSNSPNPHWMEGVSSYEMYNHRARGDRWVNGHIQTILQPDKTEASTWGTPHSPNMKPGENLYNTNKERIGGPFSFPQLQDTAFIAHYYTRSREEWNKKVARLRADTGTSVANLEQSWIDGYTRDGINLAGDVFDTHNYFMNEEEDNRVAEIWQSSL